MRDTAKRRFEMPPFFACAPEFYQEDWSYINTGVMLMNVEALRSEHEAILDFIRPNILRFAENSFDQAAYNEFYDGRISRLPVTLNWKLFWGIQPGAQIIHFHGAKPHLIKNFLDGKMRPYTDGFELKRLIEFNLDSTKHYYQLYLDYLEQSKR